MEGSFHQVLIPGVNCREPLGLPWRWTNYGPGWGASDHFPVMATFRVGGTPKSGSSSATQSSLPQTEALKVGYDKIDRSKLRNASVLTDANPEETAKAMGEIFLIQGTLSKVRPLEIEVDGKPYLLHSFDTNLKASIRLLTKGSQVKMLGQLGLFKGKLQFVVQDPSWIK